MAGYWNTLYAGVNGITPRDEILYCSPKVARLPRTLTSGMRDSVEIAYINFNFKLRGPPTRHSIKYLIISYCPLFLEEQCPDAGFKPHRRSPVVCFARRFLIRPSMSRGRGVGVISLGRFMRSGFTSRLCLCQP